MTITPFRLGDEMSDKKIIQCCQKGCEYQVVARFTWPGQDESYVCNEHEQKLISVARAIGLHLQVIPLSQPEEVK